LDARELAALLRPAGTSPLHVQLEDGLRRLIDSGELPVGVSLPGEMTLASTLGLSRHTVRHALGVLADQGLISRQRRRGTHVTGGGRASITERVLSSFYAFAWEASARGVRQRSLILERVALRATREIARHLGVEVGETITRLVRVRSAGGEPLILETAHFPPGVIDDFPAQVLERGAVYDEIERRRGLQISRAQERIRPIVLGRAAARLLETRAGVAAFDVERTTWCGDVRIEWQRAIVRGDRYLYSVELPRRR
jgi:GntR family transcriptional regulator, N-acetylglucosamine utilization regulator